MKKQDNIIEILNKCLDLWERTLDIWENQVNTERMNMVLNQSSNTYDNLSSNAILRYRRILKQGEEK